MFDLLHRDGAPQHLLQRGHGAVGNPAGHNRLEQAQVVVHIQREAVHADPLGHLDADRGDFGVADPYARVARLAMRFDAERA
jgi:hypothetical protein